jgi:hypothetical protein
VNFMRLLLVNPRFPESCWRVFIGIESPDEASLKEANKGQNTGGDILGGTNVVPQNMDYGEMLARYETLYGELLADTAIARRIRTKHRHLRNPAYSGSFSARETLAIVWRLLSRGILPGGPRRWAAFARSLPWSSPANLAWVLSDWITGLSMADFARRRLAVPLESGAAERCLATVRAAVDRYVEAGRAALHVAAGPIPAVSLTLNGLLDRRFFLLTSRSLKHLLARTPMTVTLRIEALREAEGRHLERLLRQLRRYGDRVSIVIDERLRQLVQIDSSVFNLVLAA